MPSEAPYHVCSCAKQFGRPEWNQLPRVGVQFDGEVYLELRNCDRCGSTRAVEITATEAELIRDNESLVKRCTAIADQAARDRAQAVQRAERARALVERALFRAMTAPRSNWWRPSFHAVRGGK